MNAKHTLRYAEEPGLDECFVVRKFNDWMRETRSAPVPKMLLGSLWLEGEIAVMTAVGGVGKSLLAVQIAEAIAGGRKIAPFEVTAEPQKVLYLNLKLSPKQFAMRYAEEHNAEDGEFLKNRYKFSSNLHRVDIDIHRKPPEGYRTFDEVLPPLVERLVAKTKAKVVVIDSITYLQRSVYGYRETYTLMRELHRIKTRLGISILVLARNSRRGSDAGSCPSLYSRFADSVFMIGESRLDPSARYIKQLMVRSSAKVYDESHVASFVVKRLHGNFLGFEHHGFSAENEHHQPIRENTLWPTIDKIKTLSEMGKSIREIAAELDLPKSNVHRYLQMWNEQIGAAMKQHTRGAEPYDKTKDKYYFPGREEYDEAKNDPKFRLLADPNIPDDDPRYALLMREYCIIDNASYRASQAYKKTGITPKLNEDKQYAEFKRSEDTLVLMNAASAFRNSVGGQMTDSKISLIEDDLAGGTGDEDKSVLAPNLKRSQNAYGDEIWVEEEDYRGKPMIWYSFDSKGIRYKHTRDCNGVSVTRDDEYISATIKSAEQTE
ncbi:MAG: AAA family ATPase [Pyrinomonadaceae bacterium]